MDHWPLSHLRGQHIPKVKAAFGPLLGLLPETMRATTTYIKADLHAVATALQAMTGQQTPSPYPPTHRRHRASDN